MQRGLQILFLLLNLAFSLAKNQIVGSLSRREFN